jgi:hypothetical protein
MSRKTEERKAIQSFMMGQSPQGATQKVLIDYRTNHVI